MAVACVMFWSILFGAFFYAILPRVLKTILNLFFQESDKETHLRRQISDLKSELVAISMVDEFAKYAKIQRKMNKVNDELSNQVNSRTMSLIKVKMAANVIVHAIGLLYVTFLLWNYRNEFVLIVPGDWLYPFSTILAFPLYVSGAIGTTSWLFICNRVANILTKAIT